MSAVDYDDEVVLQASRDNPDLLILADHRTRALIAVRPAERSATGFATDAEVLHTNKALLAGPGIVERWTERWADGLSDVAAWSQATGVFWRDSSWRPSRAALDYLERM